MASLLAKVVRIAAKTSTGTQAYTGVGFQPKAIIFMATAQTSATLTDGGDRVCIMVGWTDATAVGCCGTEYDTVAENLGGAWCHDDSCIALYSDVGDGTGALILAATISAVGADGFTLNYTTADGSAYVIDALCLAGDSLVAAKVVNGDLTGTAVNIDGAGFTPECALFAGVNRGTTQNVLTASGAFALGIATSTSSRRSVGVRSRNNQNADRVFQTDAVLSFAAQNPIQDDTWDLSSFDTDGGALAKDTDNSNDGMFTTLLLDGVSVALGTLTQPNATTGDQTITGIAFEPTALIAIGGCTTNETATSNAAVGMGMATAAAEEASSTWAHTDAGANTAGMSNATTRTLVSRAKTSPFGVVADADFKEFTADGYTVTWQTCDANQRLWGYLALGPAEAAGGGTILPMVMHHYYQGAA